MRGAVLVKNVIQREPPETSYRDVPESQQLFARQIEAEVKLDPGIDGALEIFIPRYLQQKRELQVSVSTEGTWRIDGDWLFIHALPTREALAMSVKAKSQRPNCR